MDTNKLIEWYQNHHRKLPWRDTKEPYKIWLSEIILQQTQVVQGLPYYQAFIKQFPTVNKLAAATEQQVLNLWQGLGYYTRARNLHYTARDIVTNYQGLFPKTYKSLLKLKGVGPYTAAAIASFCYNEPVAVVDGNVYRVLSRIFGIDTPINTTEGQKYFKQLAQDQLDRQQPAVYNQAIMEFGALHCTPAVPKCESCPLLSDCIAYQTGQVGNLPVKLSKTKVKHRYLNFYLVKYKNGIILQKRESKGIWQNLYQLPLIEQTNKDFPTHKVLTAMTGHLDILFDNPPKLIAQTKHKLTHQHLYINFWQIDSSHKPKNYVPVSKLKNYPVPAVIAKFLENNIL